MARPIDPNSMSTRIRKCFEDGRPFVAYTAADHVEDSHVGAVLRSNLPRLRMLISAVRTKCEGEYHHDFYGKYYRGDQHRGVTAWAEPDLGCIYIGVEPEIEGARRLRSREACYNLAPGETGILELTNISARDMQGQFNKMAGEHWRSGEMLAPGNGRYPVFEVRLAEPDKVQITDKKVDFLVTRRHNLHYNPNRAIAEAPFVADGEGQPDAGFDINDEGCFVGDDDEPDVPLTP